MRLFSRLADRFRLDDRGAIALKFALAVPALAVLTAGAVDLYAVQSDRARLQDLANAGALAGARELSLAGADTGPEARAKAFIDAQLAEWPQRPRQVTTTTDVLRDTDGSRSIRASLQANRASFFGSILPPGGWDMRVSATARPLALTPLCVLAHGASAPQTLVVKDAAQIRAPACLVQSNRNIEVNQTARLQAAVVQAVGTARGAITPSANTGAAPVDDPFAALNFAVGRLRTPTASDCLDSTPTVYTAGSHYLSAGVHCGGVDVRGSGNLKLGPGEHWFVGGVLQVRGNASIFGDDVVLLFGDDAQFQFSGGARVNFDGRRSGPLAGMVLVSLRDNTSDLIIAADHVERLHGVIYIPSARLVVEGSSNVGRESAWTVIVAREMRLSGSPQLFINADYGSSDVPVPAGVGPTSRGSRLVE